MQALAVLLRKDARVLGNLPLLAREQSVFKGIFILIFAGGMLGGLWYLFLEGFQFLSNLGGIGVMLIHHLFALFFFGLGLMLVLSNIITTYTTAFYSEEVPFLLCRPIAPGDIMLHKWLQTTLISSWAFFLIIIPFIGAFAWHERLSGLFMLWTFLFSIPLVLLYAGVGMLLTLLVLRWAPHFPARVWVGIALLVLLGGGCWLLLDGGKRPTDDLAFFLERFVPGLRLASFPLWPSTWVAEGIVALSRGQWLRGSLLFGVLLANALMVALLVERLGDALFVQTWLRLRAARKRTAATTRPRVALSPSRLVRHSLGDGGSAMDFGELSRAAEHGWRSRERSSLLVPETFLAFLAPDARALVIKDLRTALRDPAQWIQGFLFFGLLAFYFINLRNLHYHLLSAEWLNFIVFLNIFSLSAVMCSFSSRFIYPQLSLEGQAFWLIGLSPMTMGRILKIKFLTSLAGMLTISLVLLTVSTISLAVGWRLWVITMGLAVAMSAGLSGLATGLGAVCLDLKERNPMSIISGFGGTLNLALSLAYMTAAILPFGALNNYYVKGLIGSDVLNRWTGVASVWLLIITLAAVSLPLLAGRRSLMQRDY